MKRASLITVATALILSIVVPVLLRADDGWTLRKGTDFQTQTPDHWNYFGPAEMQKSGGQFNDTEDVGYFMIRPGKTEFDWDGLIAMGRIGNESAKRERLKMTGAKTSIAIGGQRATRYSFLEKDLNTPWQGYLILFDEPHKDGKTVGIAFAAASAKWNDYLPIYKRVIGNLKLNGATTTTTGQPTTGIVTDGQSQPIPGVTVLIGNNLRIKQSPTGSSPKDELTGQVLYAQPKTNDQGNYTWNVPAAGNYSMIFWKKHYTPAVYENVALPPAPNVQLLPDRQPGWTGRHLEWTRGDVPFRPNGPFQVNQPPVKKPGPAPIPGIYGQITANLQPLSDARVFIGENLSLKPNVSFRDELLGDALFGEVKTNNEGNFQKRLPPGFYSVVVWKRGYVPAVYGRVSVPPGDLSGNLALDSGVGSGSRHQEIITNNVRPDTPIGQVGVTGVRGRIALSYNGQPRPPKDVTVLIGRNLGLFADDITGQSPVDVVFGDALFARVKTDDRGRYFAPLPPGSYQLIVWKEHYIPEQKNTVFVPPLNYDNDLIGNPRMAGVYNTTLTYDLQPGGSGRHLKLNTDRVGEAQQVKPGECLVVGRVQLSQSGLRNPGKQVRVIIGKGLTLTSGDPVRVSGREIVSDYSDQRGRFSFSLKPGVYQVLLWKEGYQIDGPNALRVPEDGEVNRVLYPNNSPNAPGSLVIADPTAKPTRPTKPAAPRQISCVRCGKTTTYVPGVPMCTNCVSQVNLDYAMQKSAERDNPNTKRQPREQKYWQYLPKGALNKYR